MPPNPVVLFDYPFQPPRFTAVRNSSERSSQLITGREQWKVLPFSRLGNTALGHKRVSGSVSQIAAALTMSRVMIELRESTSTDGRGAIIKQWLLYPKRP